MKKQKGKMSKALINKIFVISAWIFFAVSFLWMSRALLLGYYPDFNTQYYVPRIVFSGANPYQGGNALFTPQVYPPTEFLFFLPISLLPVLTASYLYTVISIICLVVSCVLLTKIFKISFFSNINLLFMSCIFISFPTKFTLGMGQINIFVLLLLVLSLFFLQKKSDFLGGVFLGISLVIKLFPVLLPVYFLMELQKKILLGVIISFLVSVLLVIIFIPGKIYYEFIFSVLPTLLSSWKLDYYNQALSGVIGRSFGTEELAIILKSLISVIVILMTFFVTFKNRQKDFLTSSLKIGIFVTVSLLVNTFSWQHHFVWLVIPFYASIFYLRDSAAISGKEKSIYYCALVVSYFLVSINFANPKILPIILQSHVFFGSVILFLLQLKLLFKKKVS